MLTYCNAIYNLLKTPRRKGQGAGQEPSMIFFCIFIIIPLIEIALFIIVGEEIGVFSTLLLCILTAVAGSLMVRQQGLKTLFAARDAAEQGEMPVREMFDGICIAIAGVLLMIPGFFTDILGFSLLVPRIRTALRRWLAAHFEAGPPPGGASGPYEVIEAEYERLEERDK